MVGNDGLKDRPNGLNLVETLRLRHFLHVFQFFFKCQFLVVMVEVEAPSEFKGG
jgi:hypothetical protein